MICNNKSQAHNIKVITNGDSALRCICIICKQVIVVRQDQWKGVPEKRQYAKVFKRDILQGNDNLLYKYRPELMQH